MLMTGSLLIPAIGGLEFLFIQSIQKKKGKIIQVKELKKRKNYSEKKKNYCK